MPGKVFIALAAVALLLALEAGPVAAKPQLSITCAVYPGDTVVDYVGGTRRVEIALYRSDDSVAFDSEYFVKGAGFVSIPTPADAVRYRVEVDKHSGPGIVQSGYCS